MGIKWQNVKQKKRRNSESKNKQTDPLQIYEFRIVQPMILTAMTMTTMGVFYFIVCVIVSSNKTATRDKK